MEVYIATMKDKKSTIKHLTEHIARLRRVKTQRGFKTFECRRRYERTMQNLQAHLADLQEQINPKEAKRMTPTEQKKRLNTAMGWILETEGGYINDPDDKGGETKYGISKRQYTALDIANLTIEEAQEIYRVDYYDAYRCAELPQSIGLYLFDAVVNHRPGTAIKFLQRAVKTNRDGKIGPITIEAANKADLTRTIRKMNIDRAELYFGLVTANSSQAKFLSGWLSRLFKLTDFIYTENLMEQ